MNKLTQGRAILYLAAIFIAGAVAGTLLGYTSGRQKVSRPPRPGEMAEHIRSRLHDRLKLTAEQLAKIQPLIQQACAEMEGIHRESFRRVSDNFKKLNQQIAEHLTPDQKLTLAEMERERREFVQKKCHPHPNGDAGPAPDSHQPE